MPVPPDPIGEAPTAVHHVVLELVRQDDVDDPYAMPERPQTYLRRMPDGGYQTSALRWTRRFTDQLDAVRAGAQAEARQQVGRTLRAFLDGLGWATVDARIQAAVAAGERVVITLRSAAAELWRLQWALTAHGPAEAHLGALPGVLIQLAWPETHTAAPAQRSQGPERVLVAWASPTRPVPADAHIQAIAHAARAGALPFDARQDVVSRASPAALVERLEAARPERPISVLHLLCHGGAVGDAFGLTFHGPDGATVVDAGQLRALLAPFTDRVRLVVIAACDSGNDGPWASTLGSVAQALHRVGFAAVVASQRPLSGAASVTFTKHFYRALLEAPSSVEQAFVAARQALLAEASEHADWAGLQLWARADDGLDTRPVTFRPYRGLLPFEAEHARFYFGRDPQRAEVLADLQALQVAGQPQLLVVAAASGTGKSSLVRAAVLPDLRAQLPGCRVAILKPGLHPGVALERTLQRWTAAGGDGPRVLVVDQFEELFTLAPAAEVEPFCQQLWALAGGSEPVVVLVTIRVDFIGHCGQVSLTPELRLDRICYDERHQVFVPMMAPADLRQAIEGPAARVGLTLADGLADRMLRDVGAEPGHLPMLQYALDQLWQRREGDTLTHAAYEAIGGVTGALTGHADQVVDALADDARAQARRLLTELVDLSADREHATRRRVPEATIQPSEPAQAEALAHAADTLVDARLLFRSEDAEGEHALEIAHEALIRRWDRLSEWVAADREKLLVTREVVESARKHQAHDSLFQGNQLGHALDVVARYPGALPADVVQVIEASQAARDTRRRRTRIQRQLFIGFLIATSVIMVTLRATAVSNEEKAQAATRAAERLKDDALASRAEAVKSLQRAKRAGLLAFTLKALSETPALAVAALLELGPNRAHDERAQALARSLVPGPAAVYDVPSPPAVDLHFAPDSRHFAHDGRVYSLPSFLMKHRHVGRFLGFLDGGSAFAALDHRAASLILQRIGGETHTVRVPGYDMLDPDRPDLFIEEDRRAVTMMTVDRNEDTCHLRSLSMATPTWSNPRSCLGWVGGGERPANARPKSEARGDAPARHFPSDVVLKISPDGRWGARAESASWTMLDLQSNGSLTFRAPAGLKSVTVGPSGQLVILDGKGSLWVTDHYERYEWRRLGSHTGPDAQTRRGSADGVGDWGYVDYVGDWIVTVVSDTRADPADKQVQLWDASGRVGPPRLLSDLLGRAGASPVDGGVFRDRLPNGNTGVWALRPSDPRAPPHFMEFKAVWHVDARWVLGEGLAADGPLQLCSAQRGDCRPAKAPAPDHVVFGIDASGSVIAWAPRSPEGRQRPGYRLASVQGHWIGPLRRREDIVWSARFIDADTVLVDGKSVDGKGGSFPLPDDVLHGTGARPPRAEGGPLLVVRRPQLVSLLRVDDGALQRMHEANRACLPVEVRAQWLGEAKPEACRAFAACEAGHGRERPPPPTCRDLPPEAPTTQAPPLDLERLRAGNQALQQQSAALLEQAEALRATVKTIEVQLEAAREAAK